MNILYTYTDKLKGHDLIWAFLEEGYKLQPYIRSFNAVEKGEEYENLKNELIAYIKEHSYDAVISWNYFPLVSDACEATGIPYMSWIFDHPLLHVFSKNMHNSCNHIFVFDRIFTDKLKALGANAYHLPLGVNTSRLSGLVITDEDIAEYSNDMAFVGSLYQRNPYNKVKLPELIREKFDNLFIKQLGDWHNNYIYDETTDEDLEIFEKLVPIDGRENFPYISTKELYMGFFLARKYAQTEREYVLGRLAENFNITLYNSEDDKSVLKGVVCKNAVGYETQAPKVYFSTKINLNFTIKSIESGLPLRVFDIMGVGGFLLSNYQAEFDELYEPGKEVELFSSFEELEDKAAFYLRHEKERLTIAMNGYKRTCAEHTMRQRVHKMLEITFGRQL